MSAEAELSSDTDAFTPAECQIAELKTLHARWRVEDKQALSVHDRSLVLKQRCNDVGLIIFGIKPGQAQIDAIYTLFYEKRDLILLAKPGYGKSLILQQLPFMLNPTGVVLMLMPPKLLHNKQNSMINRILTGKAIVLTEENNRKTTRVAIGREPYRHVITSPEIALSKEFKEDVLDNWLFASRLSLLAIDEIHLVEESGRSFCPPYAEIHRVRRRLPSNVPLLGVSATLTKSMRLRILAKAGFRDDYKLMQTSLDRPEIQQIHRFMQHSKASCLDLQFVLPPQATHAKDIQKTLIYVNTMNEIRPLINIICAWMKQLGYPEGSDKWIRPYYSIISDWTKDIITKAFRVKGDENMECTLLVATEAYGMSIDNPDIKLVIQWDLPTSFDSMVQRLGRAGRKGGQAAFVLFTPAWTDVAGPEEIENRVKNRASVANANSELSGSNRPKKIEEVDADESDSESLSDYEHESGQEDADFTDLLAADYLNTDADIISRSKTWKNRTSKINAAKRDGLPDEIFDYIHRAECRRLFLLAWYDDQTYVSTSKALPDPCCNGRSCQSENPECLRRAPFVDKTPIYYTETDREWIAWRASELKRWRTATSNALWAEEGISEDDIPDTILMSDACLVAIAKSAEDLQDSEMKLREFLRPWPQLNKYKTDLFEFLRHSDPRSSTAPAESIRKAALKSARASRKAKYMDDPKVAEAAHINAVRDQWLLRNNKITPALKARLKKTEKAKKKGLLDIERLDHMYSQIGEFKEVLSDPDEPPESRASDQTRAQ